jgi:hypothetical protein
MDTARGTLQVSREQREGILAQVAPKIDRGGGRPESGLRAAARGIGVDRDAARRAVNIAGLDDEAKEEARNLHLDDNQSALVKAAKAQTKVTGAG